ncbi:hypothetical protein Aca07nite_02860 [Actinoplanes capillaceus]|uniref:Uncharacterized protein n=1 Tax=Actinoplanes campanulatus TaxID=113559 RepID=A0ABQ3WAT0_9ACTN|nr:hypothetical protein [Actinoplanes capillaceus]GID43011.1 hypothetical protein Aca07nite_02860 [Actinoplanes capillaceus]
MGLTGDVRVEIGELVLDGFGPSVDVDLVSAAFTTELARLVRAHGVPLASGRERELDALAGLPPVSPAVSPERLGITLARSVHAGLSGRGRRR